MEAITSKKSLVNDDIIQEKEIINQVGQIGGGLEKLMVTENGTSLEKEENRNRQMRTPPPVHIEDHELKSVEVTTPPARINGNATKDAALCTPKADGLSRPLSAKRNFSSPTEYSDSLPNQKKHVDNNGRRTSIPLSPAPNVLQHSLLTPITRNTQTVDLGGCDDLNYIMISPDDNLNSDYLSTLPIPDSNSCRIDDQNRVLAYSAQHPSLNSLPDEIFLANESNDKSFESPLKSSSQKPSPKNSSSMSRLSPSPHSKSSGYLDISSLLQSEKSTNSSNSPIPESPSTPYDHSAFYNNVSAPSEFFENLAYNNSDGLARSHHSGLCATSPGYRRSLFTKGIPKADLSRGSSLNTSMREGNHFTFPDESINGLKKPALQYQPSRNDSLGVGINKNTEGVDDIFAARSPKLGESPTLELPNSLQERQLSIPSLHRANALGNGSTASLTDGEYSWEDDTVDGEYFIEDEKKFAPDLFNSQEGNMHDIKLKLPEDHNKQTDEDLVSNAAICSVSTGNIVRHEDSSVADSSFEKENDKVVIEVGEDLMRKRGKTGKMLRRKSSRSEDLLEWIHDLQCDSENKVGEAASSKFLTKGVSINNVAPVENSFRGSPVRLKGSLEPQSVDREVMRRDIRNP